MNEILKIINKYRENKALTILFKNICNGIIFFVSIGLFLTCIESFYYLNPSIKTKLFSFFTVLFILYIIYILVSWFITINSYFNYQNNFKIAFEIGQKNKSIGDELLNVLQINKQSDKQNLDLTKYATESIKNKLKIEFKNIFIFPKKEIRVALFTLISMILIMLNLNLQQATIRLIKYDELFSMPLPFTLETISDSFTALEGDTLDINISGVGLIPDSISIKYIINDTIKNNIVVNNNQIYSLKIKNLKSNITYWGEYESSNFLSPWQKINTARNKVTVKKRPVINKVNFKITPPEYSGLKPYVHNKTNINQINILNGSDIEVKANANNNLNSAWILNNNKRIVMDISKNSMTSELNFTEDMKLSIYCINDEFISNINPIQYSLILQKDENPNLNIQSPEYEFELDETMLIPLKFNVYDDYGIENIWIEYRIESQGFTEKMNEMSIYNIMYLDYTDKEIYVDNEWDIQDFNIFMGDQIKFRICTSDKNTISGPGITKSIEFIGSFPSLEDLFTRVESYEDNIQDIAQDMESTLEEISEITEEMILESLKSEDVSWEQEQKLEKTFTQMDELIQEIEKIQENIDDILKQADNNNLFDNDLIQKFEQFKEMLNSMMNEEMMEAMEKLQEAFKGLDQNKLMDALKNYEFNIEKFEEELDRFMDMFEMAMAEQKLNELSEHIENMINKQNELIDDLVTEENDYTLKKKSKKQETRFSDFDDLLEETKETIQPVSEETAQKLNDFQNSNLQKETENLFSKQTENISNNKKDSNIPNNTKKNLKEISNNLNEMIQQFKDESITKLTKEFIIILDNLITISNQQEKINLDTKEVRSNSPEIKNLNKRQNNIDRELNQVTKQLVILSTQTFFINPKINHLLGKLKNSIARTILDLEQKKISKTRNHQINNLKIINEVTFMLLTSMEEMQNSSSASGFEKFLESMEKMSQQQQGINQGTMQLGQMGMMMQKSFLEQLMQQQQQLQQQLGELLSDNPGDELGGLSKAKDDMEETIKDFQNNNVTKKTIERQQQILSRMLDSQKSLTKKDFDKKRQGKSGINFTYSGEKNLNIGNDKDLMLIDAMEDAIEEGLSMEYQKLIRLYFLELQKEDNNVK